MITDKLTIYGDKENKERIEALLMKCTQILSLEWTDTQVYTDSLPESVTLSVARNTVLEYKEKERLSEGVKYVTYSMSDSRSDVTALNVQNREQSVCFELLHKSYMSRIFIPHTREYTPKQILICSAVLLSMGVTAEKIVETINEILK